MRRIVQVLLLLIITTHSSAQALSWAYLFVVWNGNVYEVTEEEVIEVDIGKAIGEVKRKANDMTGSYYGDASNFYPTETKYYAINGESTESTIAVEVAENQWIKAIYVHKAPFHWMDLLTKYIPSLILTIVVIIGVLKMKNRISKRAIQF